MADHKKAQEDQALSTPPPALLPQLHLFQHPPKLIYKSPYGPPKPAKDSDSDDIPLSEIMAGKKSARALQRDEGQYSLDISLRFC